MDEAIAAAVVGGLQALVVDADRAALAALRRCAGRPPEATLRRCGRWLLPFIPAVAPRWVGESSATLAVLFALWHQGLPTAGWTVAPSLGGSLRQLGDAAGQARSARLLERLLGRDAEDLPRHLAYVVRQMRGHGVPVDWVRLLRNLDAWVHPARHLQRQWATDFWSASARDEEERDADRAAPAQPDRAE